MAKAKAKAKSSLKAKIKNKPKPANKGKNKTKPKPKSKPKPKPKQKQKPLSKVSGKTAGKAKAKASVQAKKPQAKSAARSTKVATVKTPSTKRDVAAGTAWSRLLTPLDDRVLVQVEAGEKRTAGGLYIPDTVDGRGNFQGTVVAVGPGHRDGKGRFRPLELKVGDRILFDAWTGTEVQLGERSFKILRETEVLGLVDSTI